MRRSRLVVVTLLAGLVCVGACGRADGEADPSGQPESVADESGPTAPLTSSPVEGTIPATPPPSASSDAGPPSDTAEAVSTTTSLEGPATSAATTETILPALDGTDADEIDLSPIEPLIGTAAIQSRLGTSTLSINDIIRAFPRAALDGYYTINDSVAVGVPLESTCAWFLGSAPGEVLLADSTGSTCDPSVELSSPSIDGISLSWAPDALAKIDTIAQLNATAVLDGLERAILVERRLPTPSDIQDGFPGLSVLGGDDASSARELSVDLNGSSVAIAVRGQSGLCYLISTRISSDTTVRYGTGDVCTASAAVSNATAANWP